MAMLEELRTQQEYADFITARYAGMTGDIEAASTYYRRAHSTSPNDSSLLELAILSTLAIGASEEAIKLAKRARPPVAEDSATAQIALAVDDIAANRLKQAQARLRNPALGALNIDLSSFLETWLIALDDADAGVTTVDTLSGRRMIAGEQAILKALVLMQAGRDTDAVESFRHGLRLPLATRDGVAALGARLAASQGDADGARDLIRLSALDGVYGPGAAAVLADIDSGRAIAKPKLSAREGAAFAIFVVSGTGLVRSSPELSAVRQTLALYLDPGLVPARMALADAYERQQRADAAIAALRAIPDGSPWTADARMEEAWLLDASGLPAEALAAADRALAASNRREIRLRAGDLNRTSGRLDVARRLYDQVIAADTASGMQDWRVLFARATVRNETGDWPGAEADLQAALAIEPGRAELLNYLGYGWVNRGERVNEGLALIQQAAESRPDQGYIIDSLGWAHYRLGQYDTAIEYLERASALSPTDPEIIDHLGDAYWRAGRTVEARFKWSAALNLKPDASQEAALRGKLAKGLPAEPGASLASRP
jgi:tetratricopeptide (TPR) repeat protein